MIRPKPKFAVGDRVVHEPKFDVVGVVTRCYSNTELVLIESWCYEVNWPRADWNQTPFMIETAVYFASAIDALGSLV